LARRCSE